MNFYKDKIIFTGGNGRFGKVFKKEHLNKNILYPSKRNLNIENIHSINNYLKKHKPKIIIHTAGLSRPMNIHDTKPQKSIKKNIIGTSNLAIACLNLKIKLIYFSTNYVYPINNKLHKETDSVLPINKYGYSKLGGECAVRLCKNYLILRIFMTQRPFAHKEAYCDIKTNLIYHNEVAKLIPFIINENGIINIGGKQQSVFKFAKLSNNKVKKVFAKRILKSNFYPKQVLSIQKLKKLLKNYI